MKSWILRLENKLWIILLCYFFSEITLGKTRRSQDVNHIEKVFLKYDAHSCFPYNQNPCCPTLMITTLITYFAFKWIFESEEFFKGTIWNAQCFGIQSFHLYKIYCISFTWVQDERKLLSNYPALSPSLCWTSRVWKAPLDHVGKRAAVLPWLLRDAGAVPSHLPHRKSVHSCSSLDGVCISPHPPCDPAQQHSLHLIQQGWRPHLVA